MFKILKRAIQTGVVTAPYPPTSNPAPKGTRGKPVIDFARCTACDQCADACPTNAITVAAAGEQKVLTLTYGDCIFCGECEAACPDTIALSNEHAPAVRRKWDLTTRAVYKVNAAGSGTLVEVERTLPSGPGAIDKVGEELRKNIHRLFGRSLHIREVDAGSCNGCEIEITSLNNAIYDVERFGIHFVASPRHADMLLVTGPVTRNMEIALKQTYNATPSPKLVVAVGACAIGGGIFGATYTSCGGVDQVVPVDVYIPGCPPRPEALLEGILLAISD